MTDRSTILQHESATIGEFKEGITQKLIATLAAQAGINQIVEKIGVYEVHGSGCDWYDVLLVFLSVVTPENEQIVIAALQDWLFDKESSGKNILEFSRG